MQHDIPDFQLKSAQDQALLGSEAAEGAVRASCNLAYLGKGERCRFSCA